MWNMELDIGSLRNNDRRFISFVDDLVFDSIVHDGKYFSRGGGLVNVYLIKRTDAFEYYNLVEVGLSSSADFKDPPFNYEQRHISDGILQYHVIFSNGYSIEIYWEESGDYSKQYWRNLRLHCEFEPALMEFNKQGKLNLSGYYLNDEEMSKEEWEKKMMVKLYW